MNHIKKGTVGSGMQFTWCGLHLENLDNNSVIFEENCLLFLRENLILPCKCCMNKIQSIVRQRMLGI